MKTYVRRRNERLEREREAMEAARGGGDARYQAGGREPSSGQSAKRQDGLTAFCLEERRRGKVKRLPRRSDRLKRLGDPTQN